MSQEKSGLNPRNAWISVPKRPESKLSASRGGQKTVEPDPPNKSGRLARPLARPWIYIRTDTDTNILNIRITDG